MDPSLADKVFLVCQVFLSLSKKVLGGSLHEKSPFFLNLFQFMSWVMSETGCGFKKNRRHI